MITDKYKAKVTPSCQVFRLTRQEVCKAIFAFALGRKPTDDEVGRLGVNVYNDGHIPWTLSLSFEDQPPNLIPKAGPGEVECT